MLFIIEKLTSLMCFALYREYRLEASHWTRPQHKEESWESQPEHLDTSRDVVASGRTGYALFMYSVCVCVL